MVEVQFKCNGCDSIGIVSPAIRLCTECFSKHDHHHNLLRYLETFRQEILKERMGSVTAPRQAIKLATLTSIYRSLDIVELNVKSGTYNAGLAHIKFSLDVHLDDLDEINCLEQVKHIVETMQVLTELKSLWQLEGIVVYN